MCIRDRDYVSGEQDSYQRFLKFVEALELAVGNPMYHWCNLELRRFFGYEGHLSLDTAKEVWDLCNDKLRHDPDLTVRGIIRKANVAFIGTTDDPVDSLEWHEKIAADPTISFQVCPSFRPDKAINIHKPGFTAYVKELAKSVGKEHLASVEAVSYTHLSNLFFLPRNNVQWAGYSQVDCTLKLLKAAVQKGPYQYYHFLTGSTFPLKNQDDMHAFFDTHKGTEFVGFDNHTTTIERVKYYHLFHESGKLTGLSGHIKSGLRESAKFIQKLLSVDLFKKYHLEYKKGFAYWSITDDAARYLIDHEAIIYRMLRYSISGDEVFVQVLLYNSQFQSKLYSCLLYTSRCV